MLIPGRTGSGKTSHALALAFGLRNNPETEPLNNFLYIDEPRAPLNPWSEKLENPALTDEVLRDMLREYGQTGPSLVIDSMTYRIPELGVLRMGGQEDPFMKEGLRKSDVLGVLRLDSIAREAGMTLFATVNSDLFPRTRVLEGACEGMITIEGQRRLLVRDRITRAHDILILHETDYTNALSQLQYSSSSSETSYEGGEI
jgi:hypothetical protein